MRYLNLESDSPVNLREEVAEAEHVDGMFDSLYDVAEIKAKSLDGDTRKRIRNTAPLNTWGTRG